MTTVDMCEFVVHAATIINPPEYCDEEAIEGSEFCAQHEEYVNGDPDDEYERFRDFHQGWDDE